MGIFCIILALFGLVLGIMYIVKTDTFTKLNPKCSKNTFRVCGVVIIVSALIILVCGIRVAIIDYNNTSYSSSESTEKWEKDANDAGYYKKNGKWYYQGDGAY